MHADLNMIAMIGTSDQPCWLTEACKLSSFFSGLARLPLISVNLDTVQTNIIIFQLKPGAPDKAVFLRNLRERHGVLMSGFLKGVRAVTHFDVSEEDCQYALAAVEESLQLGEVQSNGAASNKAKQELHQNVNGTLKGYE